MLSTLGVGLALRLTPPASSPSEYSGIGDARVPFSDLGFRGPVLALAGGLDELASDGSESEEASGAADSAAVTDAAGARMLTFFDFGFFGVLEEGERRVSVCCGEDESARITLACLGARPVRSRRRSPSASSAQSACVGLVRAPSRR